MCQRDQSKEVNNGIKYTEGRLVASEMSLLQLREGKGHFRSRGALVVGLDL